MAGTNDAPVSLCRPRDTKGLKECEDRVCSTKKERTMKSRTLTCIGIGFFWQNDLMMDLNNLIPAGSPLFLFEPTSINARGEIVGAALDTNTFEVRAFLATPCDREASDDNACEDSAESATAAKRAALGESPQVVLPENVRKLLQQRRGFGRFLGPAIRPSTD